MQLSKLTHLAYGSFKVSDPFFCLLCFVGLLLVGVCILGLVFWW